MSKKRCVGEQDVARNAALTGETALGGREGGRRQTAVADMFGLARLCSAMVGPARHLAVQSMLDALYLVGEGGAGLQLVAPCDWEMFLQIARRLTTATSRITSRRDRCQRTMHGKSNGVRNAAFKSAFYKRNGHGRARR